MKRFLSALIIFIPALAMAADPKVDARNYSGGAWSPYLSIGPSDPLIPANHK
jgi:hypothetical protein